MSMYTIKMYLQNVDAGEQKHSLSTVVIRAMSLSHTIFKTTLHL